MKIITLTDNRINRDNNFGGYQTLSNELVKNETGYDKKFSGGSMSWDNYTSTAYKKTYFDDVQIDITLDFNSHTATIKIGDIIKKPEWMKELEENRKAQA